MRAAPRRATHDVVTPSRLPDPTTMHGWGRHAAVGVEIAPTELLPVSKEVGLARGLGRSYGDASLPSSEGRLTLNTKNADRILAFDESTGRLRAEAGLSLDVLNRLLMPRGFFPPVTPGTKFVTLGGMVAADVHGKNQHAAGNIGHHVASMKMLVADQRVVECSRTENADLFHATLGGMGLTGVVLEVELTMSRIASPWIWQETRRIHDVDEFEAALVDAAPQWPFTMGWLDCFSTGKTFGRGLMMTGRWADPSEAPKGAPPDKRKSRLSFDFPEMALNPLTIRAFNETVYRSQWKRVSSGFTTPDKYWYPLDSVHEWYRMYGKRGFTQYQFVLPRTAKGGTRRMLDALHKLGANPFLCVIKDFGQGTEGTIGFPMPGITLAIDIPVRDDTQRVIDEMNEKVIAEGGRIYLAKDSFTRGEHYRAMDARVSSFEAIRAKWDPNKRFRSALSVRIFGDEK